MPSGAFEVGAGGNSNQQKWRLRLEYSYTNKIEENKSYITWTLMVYNGTGSSHVDDGSPYYQITDYDSQHYGSYNFPSTGWYTLGTFDDNYSHNSDGSRTINVHAIWYSGNEGSSYTPLSIEINDTLTFDPIPRTSSVYCSSGNITETATITIDRHSSEFTHTLSYSFGSASGTIISGYTGTSYAWTLPASLYAQIPNNQSGSGTITCQTFSGGTLIGTSSVGFTAYAKESLCGPVVNALSIVDTNSTTTALTGNSATLVKYYSNAQITITASARGSASLVGYTVQCGDGKYFNGASGTLTGVESGAFTGYVTDSRGYGANLSATKTMIQYIKLTCAQTITPPGATTGVATVAVSGNYFNGSFGVTANTLTVQYRYKLSGGTYSSWTDISATISGNGYSGTASISGLTYTNSYVFQSRAIDKINTSGVNTAEQTVHTEPVFDWSKNDFKFNVPVSMASPLPIASGGTGNTSGKAQTAYKADAVLGVYTSNGGQQPPSYIPSNTVKFNMMNALTGAIGPGYCDWMMMDTYQGSDVPWATAFGVLKANAPRAFIGVGAKGGSSWSAGAELLTTYNTNAHIVAAGWSNGWYYYKWSTGWIEGWRYDRVDNVNINNAWGSVYESEMHSLTNIGLSCTTWSLYDVVLSGASAGVMGIEIGGWNTGGSPNFWFTRATVGTGLTIHIVGHFFGF